MMLPAAQLKMVDSYSIHWLRFGVAKQSVAAAFHPVDVEIAQVASAYVSSLQLDFESAVANLFDLQFVRGDCSPGSSAISGQGITLHSRQDGNHRDAFV